MTKQIQKRANILKHVALVVWKSILLIRNGCNVSWLKHKRPRIRFNLRFV